MTDSPKTYLNSRVLKLNVGFLLADGPAHSHDSTLDFPRVKVSDDLRLNYLRGPLRLSRTKEGILVQANFEVAVDDECFRCLDPKEHVMHLDLEELFAVNRYNDAAEFFITEDAQLDLAPLVRAEAIIAQSYNAPFRLDKNDTCGVCKKTFTKEDATPDDDLIDPRLAILKQLLDD